MRHQPIRETGPAWALAWDRAAPSNHKMMPHPASSVPRRVPRRAYTKLSECGGMPRRPADPGKSGHEWQNQ